MVRSNSGKISNYVISYKTCIMTRHFYFASMTMLCSKIDDIPIILNLLVDRDW